MATITNNANAATAIIGKVAVLQGQAFIQHVDGTRVELKVGDVVHEGDVIVTSPGAVVELGFNDGHSYVVQQNETVTLDASVFNSAPVDVTSAAVAPNMVSHRWSMQNRLTRVYRRAKPRRSSGWAPARPFWPRRM